MKDGCGFLALSRLLNHLEDLPYFPRNQKFWKGKSAGKSSDKVRVRAMEGKWPKVGKWS